MFKVAIKFCEIHAIHKKKIGKAYICKSCRKERYKKDRMENPEKYENAFKKIRKEIPSDWNDEMVVKKCHSHGDLKLKDIYFINENNIRCKYCRRESSSRTRNKNKDVYNAIVRYRRKNKPGYAERIRERSKKNRKIHYYLNREEILKKRRDSHDSLKRFRLLLKSRYGLSLDDYELMLEKQNFVCDICGEKETSIHHKTKEIKKLGVDHNHTTKQVRSLLCTRCNCMIGYARDSEKYLQAGIDYLRKHNAKTSAKNESGDNRSANQDC